MKYQIILESSAQFTDDEISTIVQKWVDDNGFNFNLSLVYAMSCEGLRKELYELKENLKDEIPWIEDTPDKNELIENTFNNLENLFKIK